MTLGFPGEKGPSMLAATPRPANDVAMAMSHPSGAPWVGCTHAVLVVDIQNSVSTKQHIAHWHAMMTTLEHMHYYYQY